MKRHSKLLLGMALALGLSVHSGAALAANCSDQVQTYTVATGDTLSRIALKVYDDPATWPIIFEYPGNAARIGKNPNILTLGTTLQIPPCPGTVAALPTEEDIRQVGPRNTLATDVASRIPVPIYIAAHKNYAPYNSPAWPEGGMATMIVKAAFQAAGLGERVRIHHIGDVHAHFKYLLPTGRHHLSVGWHMPDMDYWKTCAALPASMQPRCSYKPSDPILTMAFSFFYEVGRSDLQNADLNLIRRARLCRPNGWSTFQLEENGIALDNLVTPGNLEDCFKLLLAGEVDFVVASRLAAVSLATRMGVHAQVEMAAFTGVSFGFHLLAHEDNLNGSFNYLNAFNEGLQIIIDEGIYGQITSYYNDEFARRLAER